MKKNVTCDLKLHQKNSGEEMKKFLTVTLLGISSVSVMAGTEREKIVYGDDNRKEVFEVEEKIQKIAASTAAMIENKDLIKVGKSVMLPPSELGRDWNLCSGEKFADQASSAMCSGFLIGPDLLVTAGHCVQTEEDCKKISWVFDFKINQDTNKADMMISNEKVFACKKVIRASLETPMAPGEEAFKRDDFALIQLDRVVVGRTPLKFRTEGAIEKESGVYVIGHPSGIPTKVTDGGFVRDNSHKQFFKTNLDTFGGNSGSAVFSTETDTIEGILVRGDRDYVMDPVKRCYRVNTVDEAKGEEAVTRITNIVELKYRDAMYEAARMNDVKAVNAILAKGYDINFYNNNKSTALHVAAYFGKLSVVRELIAKGADLNAKNMLGQTPLEVAQKANRPKTAQLLTDALK
jgi:V8-like Glu-specific endopeptidase